MIFIALGLKVLAERGMKKVTVHLWRNKTHRHCQRNLGVAKQGTPLSHLQ